MRQRRQLAAIMFTDMIGYTAMMSRDEVLAGRLRQRHREVIRLRHEQYFGDIIQYFGDGTLSIFNSTVDAVQCAIDIQLDLRKDPIVPLRIGLHFGELVREEEDVFGSAVNIASRLESFAVEGAILTSQKVRAELSNQPDFHFNSLGTFQLKNVPQPMQIFAVSNDGILVPDPKELDGKGKRIEDNPVKTALPNLPLPPITGKSGVIVNDLLIDLICENLAEYSKDLDDELNKEDLDIPSIKREIVDVFPTPIGEQLRVLFTRSNDSRRPDEMEYFSVGRLKQLVSTYNTTLQFINFILLSQLWDEKYKNENLKLSEEQLAVCKKFYKTSIENFNELDHANLINSISNVFKENNISFFLDELKSFNLNNGKDEELDSSYQYIKNLQIELNQGDIDAEQVETKCLDAEEKLGILLKRIAFLVQYKLVTIKNIELVKSRHESVRYRHNQITLNRALTVATTGVTEVGIDFDNFADNKSVIFLKRDNNEIIGYLNLTPFIIDENALNGNQSSKIYLFIYYMNDAYHYQFMNNPSDQPLVINKKFYPQIKNQFDRFWAKIFSQEPDFVKQLEKDKGGSRFSRKR